MTKLKSALAAMLLLVVASCERIKDSTDNCGVWLEFVFDHNMEYTDSFGEQVKTVDVYVFDSAGRFVETRHAAIDQLVGRKRMFLDDLRFGDYQILTVGNLAREHFKVNIATIDRAELALVHNGVVAHRFEHLFVGPTVDVKYNADQTVYRVPLVRQTNNFNITLQTSELKTRQATPAHTVNITAPESGAYNCHNSPTDRRKVTYQPHSLSAESDHTSAKINTMRLLEDEQGGYRIAVRNTSDGKEIWGTDLLPLLAATKPATRPDGSPLPSAEYYDREGEWNIVIVHRDATPSDPEHGFVALKIVINGWIVWENPMGI